MIWPRNQYHCNTGGFAFSGTLGNASAYSILPISDGGLKFFFIQLYSFDTLHSNCFFISILENDMSKKLFIKKYLFQINKAPIMVTGALL
jgi:hypothetical protein